MGRIQVTCPDKVSVFRSLMDPVPSLDSASATAASIAPLPSAPGSTRMAGEESNYLQCLEIGSYATIRQLTIDAWQGVGEAPTGHGPSLTGPPRK
jgi:hypothetical protein